MKKRYAALSAVFLVAALLVAITPHIPSERNAKRRLNELNYLINYRYDQPQKIYRYLSEEYRNSISEEDFVNAFVKERSYPYLTPFFLNFLSIEMEPGSKTGVGKFSQAARLGGMFVDIPIVYENFNYFMEVGEYSGFPDGSYLEKFERIPSYLIHGWDLEDADE